MESWSELHGFWEHHGQATCLQELWRIQAVGEVCLLTCFQVPMRHSVSAVSASRARLSRQGLRRNGAGPGSQLPPPAGYLRCMVTVPF